MKLDLALASNREFWLRHPVLGDPSFDTFERVGKPVHISKPPYEWTVNCSIFRDLDGTWYCYPGLYPKGYVHSPDGVAHFEIYRSRDKGETWEPLGPGKGFEPGFVFPGHHEAWDSCPDVMVCFDKKTGKYLMTYDGSTNDFTWENAFDPNCAVDSGAAFAWADTPAGPFHRLTSLPVSNKRHFGAMGRWRRMYATTAFPREHDYILFTLNDSAAYYAWALAAMTAPSPEGPWSDPIELLCCDRPDFYPCPCEFFPVELIDGVCYAPATSVAMNRDYQFVFSAPLERAHDPAAWKMLTDGSVWHSRDLPDEYAGIWGQTHNGFVDPDTGRFVVAFPSRDDRGYGIINIASRPWDTPFSDGFSMASHQGPSVTLVRAAYTSFALEAAFSAKGTVDFVFDYDGVLGPDDSVADSVPNLTALRAYSAVRVENGTCSLISVAADGTVTTDASCVFDAPITSLRLTREGGTVRAEANGVSFGSLSLSGDVARPVGLVLQPRSRIDCTKFELSGEPVRWTMHWNALDGVLGAGQLHPEMETVGLSDELARDVWHRLENGVVGEGRVTLKWNVLCDSFTVRTLRGAELGQMGVWVDGRFVKSLDLNSDRAELSIVGLEYGRHAVRVEPLSGRIAVTGLEAEGAPELV